MAFDQNNPLDLDYLKNLQERAKEKTNIFGSPSILMPEEKLQSLSSSPTPNTENLPEPTPPSPPKKRTMGLDATMQMLASLESGGGKNINHDVIDDRNSIHYGTGAAGKYALMPNTIHEIINRKLIPVDNRLEQLLKVPKTDVNTYREFINKNPDLEEALARSLVKNMYKRGLKTPQQIQHAWLRGHNLTPEYFSGGEFQKDLKEHKQAKIMRERIKKVNEFVKNYLTTNNDS